MSARMQPLFILAEGSERTRGQDAQDSNIRAGKAVAASVRSTLGPRGMDKMLVDSSGDVVITNDGATILAEMDIEHPAAQMIVEVAETQEEEVGDGTTTAAVLTGELLIKAEDLLEDDLHPTVIVEGYDQAAQLAHEAIDANVIAADPSTDQLVEVAETSMTGKGTGDIEAATLAAYVVEAVDLVAAANDRFDPRDIRIVTKTGASSSATQLVEGVVVDAERMSEQMPGVVEDVTVAVLDVELDVRESEIDAEYDITSVDQLTAAIDAEDAELAGYASILADAGVDAVFSSKDIADRVASHLSKHGIVAFDDLKDKEVAAVAKATGARRLGTLNALDTADLGAADAVRVETFGEDEAAFVEGGSASKTATLLVRGGTEHIVDELERAIQDAVDVTIAARTTGGIVPGAGASEVAIADAIRAAADGIEGRKQLAVRAFAEAVESLPRILAENTGMDSIDAVVDLRAAHEETGSAGIISAGRSGEIGDPVAAGIVDPAAVKHGAVAAATEASTMIVRIDDVIAAD
jgi:thermosome subunit